MEDNSLFDLIDLFASEYGWTMEYILSLPHDVLKKLSITLSERIKRELQMKAQLDALVVNCGFSGEMKPLNKLFNNSSEEGISEEVWKEQNRALWIKMKQKTKTAEEFNDLQKEFEERWAAGTVEF